MKLYIRGLPDLECNERGAGSNGQRPGPAVATQLEDPCQQVSASASSSQERTRQAPAAKRGVAERRWTRVQERSAGPGGEQHAGRRCCGARCKLKDNQCFFPAGARGRAWGPSAAGMYSWFRMQYSHGRKYWLRCTFQSMPRTSDGLRTAMLTLSESAGPV